MTTDCLNNTRSFLLSHEDKRLSLVMRQKTLNFVAEFATLFAGNRRALNIKCHVLTRKGQLGCVQMGCDIAYSDIGKGLQKARTSLW